MGFRRLPLIAAMALPGLLLAFVIGPTVGSATTAVEGDVKIIDRATSDRAAVDDNHRLTLDTEAGRTDLGGGTYFLDTQGLQSRLPNGEHVLAGGGGCSTAISTPSILSAIQVNLSTPNATIRVEVTVRDTFGGGIIWQTSYDLNEVGEHDITFDGGVYMLDGFNALGSPTVGLTCQFIGQDLGAQGSAIHAPTP
jgi:hypothetical protein